MRTNDIALFAAKRANETKLCMHLFAIGNDGLSIGFTSVQTTQNNEHYVTKFTMPLEMLQTFTDDSLKQEIESYIHGITETILGVDNASRN